MSVQNIARPNSLSRSAAIGLLIEQATTRPSGAKTVITTARLALSTTACFTKFNSAQCVTRRLRPWLSARSNSPIKTTLQSTSRLYGTRGSLSRASNKGFRDHSSDPASPRRPFCADISRDELRSIVDTSETIPPLKPQCNPNIETKVSLPDVPVRDPSWKPAAPGKRAVLKPALDIRRRVDRLRGILRQDQPVPQVVYSAYQDLPTPRLVYLKDPTIDKLCRVFRRLEHKSEMNMLWYFSILDEMTSAGIPLRNADWNASIAFAAQWTSDTVKIDSSMQILSRMEEAGFSAGIITFNTLFHTATRAGRFVLAEVILREMQRRQIKPDHITRLSNILYCGLKGDGRGLREVYQQMIDAGEVIDTKVLNCVVVSLIRAREPAAAEQVFERMKQLSRRSPIDIVVPRSCQDTRRYNQLLQKAHHYTAQRPEKREYLQQVVSIAPDLHTYRALIRHHARDSGNIDRIMSHLQDMQSSGFHRHGSIFWHIFAGFERHGGLRFSSWTLARLETIWTSFAAELDCARHTAADSTHDDLLAEDDRSCRLDPSIAVVVLKAYATCADTSTAAKKRNEISRLWTPSEEAELAMDEAMIEICKSK